LNSRRAMLAANSITETVGEKTPGLAIGETEFEHITRIVIDKARLLFLCVRSSTLWTST
jgi:hypothetical protein